MKSTLAVPSWCARPSICCLHVSNTRDRRVLLRALADLRGTRMSPGSRSSDDAAGFLCEDASKESQRVGRPTRGELMKWKTVKTVLWSAAGGAVVWWIMLSAVLGWIP